MRARSLCPPGDVPLTSHYFQDFLRELCETRKMVANEKYRRELFQSPQGLFFFYFTAGIKRMEIFSSVCVCVSYSTSCFCVLHISIVCFHISCNSTSFKTRWTNEYNLLDKPLGRDGPTEICA